MKTFLIILFCLIFLDNTYLIIDIKPFIETEITTSIGSNSVGYFKIDLRNVKEEEKKNLYIQYRIRLLNTGKYFTVDASGFSKEPSEQDIINSNSTQNIPGEQESDSYYFYYRYKIPKFENMNWLIIRTINQYNSYISLTSFYVYSTKNTENENRETKQYLSWNSWSISITIISLVNTLLLVFILFKIITLKNKSPDNINIPLVE